MANLNDIDGIIFDYGGVLVSHQLQADIAKLAELAGLNRAGLDKRYWARRAEYDRDEVNLAEYWHEIVDHSIELTDERLAELSKADTSSWMHYDPPMWEWVEELRTAGKRVAMLSNMPRDLGMRLRFDTTRLEFFDHVTLSFELRIAKPDVAIYEHCLSGLGTAAERTLFLDDRLENVLGARKLGITAIEFNSRDDVLPALLQP